MKEFFNLTFVVIYWVLFIAAFLLLLMFLIKDFIWKYIL